jgi:hypothetical protein
MAENIDPSHQDTNYVKAIKYASQILGLNEELQNKILQLHHSTSDETKNNFMEVWDDFKSFGCFC